MVRILLVLVAVAVGACLGLSGPQVSPTPRFLARRQAPIKVGDLVQEFGLDLSSEVQADGNLVLSPLSVAVLLASLMLGTEGLANQQLQEVLYLPPGVSEGRVHTRFQELLANITRTHPQVTVNVANGLFLQGGVQVQSQYSNLARRYYGTEVRTVNFRRPIATATVNRWVRDKTEGLIPRLLTEPLSPQTTFFAANTVFFNGTWETPFLPQDTQDDTFHTVTGPVQVAMMNAVMPVSFVDIPEMNAHMIALPYMGHQLAMYILMRKDSVPRSSQDLLNLEYSLDARTLDLLINNMTQLDMSVSLPRMRLTYRTSLTNALKGLGVTAIFSPQLAGFHRLTVQEPVWVEEVVHEAVVEVTEKGTTAAAATGAGLNRIAVNKAFRVDRPAIFFIRDTVTGVPLFWGRVVRPEPLPRSG